MAQPSWSPNGKRIVIQSYRSGNFHLWTVAPDGSDLKQLTTGFADHREPAFSPDGRSIIFSSDISGRYAIHRLDLTSGRMTEISHGTGQDSEPCFSRDGTCFAYIADGTTLKLSTLAGSLKTIVTVSKPTNWTHHSALHAPSFAPDGQIAYTSVEVATIQLHVGDKVIAAGEDIFPFRTSWFPNGDLLYASNGKIRHASPLGKTVIIPFTAIGAVTTPSYPHTTNATSTTPPHALSSALARRSCHPTAKPSLCAHLTTFTC